MMIELRSDIQKWIRIAFINLLIVALLGTIMRYKIAYYFPLIEQKIFYMRTLICICRLGNTSFNNYAGCLSQYENTQKFFKKYKWLLTANLVTAYGMLLSFPWEGYGIVSITFSTLSIFVSYAFAFFLERFKPSTCKICKSFVVQGGTYFQYYFVNRCICACIHVSK